MINYLVVATYGIKLKEGGYMANSYGPFKVHERAEDCVLELSKRPDVKGANITKTEVRE